VTPGGAVVLGSDYRGLGFAQSLGRRGIEVALVHEPGRGLANFSRYVSRAFPWPGATQPERVHFLMDLADRQGLAGWLLVPTADETAALVSRASKLLEDRFRSTVPPWTVLEWAYDKRLTERLAAAAEVPYPLTWRPGSRGVASLDCTFPVIVKPAVKRTQNDLTIAKAWRADDRATLARLFAAAARLMPDDELLVQELIPGTGEDQYSFAALAIEGRPVATLVARRTRQYPMDFGRASTFVETIHEPEVAELGERVVETLRHSGLVEVEWKRDRRTGELKLLDVNARIWGWLTLGRRAGVDFPWLLWNVACGLAPEPVEAAPGIRWMWPVTDVPVAARELLHRRLRIRDYVSSFRRPLDLATLTLDDPLPGLVEPPLRLLDAWRARSRSRAPGPAPFGSKVPVR
jgi:D-aspartate ligase